MFAANPILNHPLSIGSANPEPMRHPPSLQDILLAFLAGRNTHFAGTCPQIGLASRVFDDGLIDSLSFIELIGRIEATLDTRIDMLAVDFDAIHTVSDLIFQIGQAMGPNGKAAGPA